jgi:hypothetical protein
MTELQEEEYNKRFMIDIDSEGKDFVFFWKPEEENACFGNWFPLAFSVDGIHFHTSEHYVMYHKALLMGDEEIARAVLEDPDPHSAKKWGQRVKPWSQDIWNRERCRIMYEACFAKFQAEDMRQRLLNTGDAVLVEASPYDKIWGIGLLKTDKNARNPQRWKGLNLLGKVLMKIRQDVRYSQTLGPQELA